MMDFQEKGIILLRLVYIPGGSAANRPRFWRTHFLLRSYGPRRQIYDDKHHLERWLAGQLKATVTAADLGTDEGVSWPAEDGADPGPFQPFPSMESLLRDIRSLVED